METKKGAVSRELFKWDGKPSWGEALPLALQHVVAMIVGCVTPAIIISGAAGLSPEDSVILIQAALTMSAVTTLLQLFPFIRAKGFAFGSALPVIMGISFAYVPSMQAIAESFDIQTILGAQVAVVVLVIVTVLNHFGKGVWKLASILIGMGAGYVIALAMGMVDFSPVAETGFFELPRPMHFGMKFEPSSCVAISIIFAINAVQAIGDFSATTTGGMDRMPTDEELQGGIFAYGISNIVCAMFGGLATATYSQNVGIVASTKVVARRVFIGAALILLTAGLVPKFSSILTTIPQCVLGGATISVFASIAMTGIKLITSQRMDFRNMTVVGLAVAVGMGITQANASLARFPAWVTTIFGKSPVVLAMIVAVILNVILPKTQDEDEE